MKLINSSPTPREKCFSFNAGLLSSVLIFTFLATVALSFYLQLFVAPEEVYSQCGALGASGDPLYEGGPCKVTNSSALTSSFDAGGNAIVIVDGNEHNSGCGTAYTGGRFEAKAFRSAHFFNGGEGRYQAFDDPENKITSITYPTTPQNAACMAISNPTAVDGQGRWHGEYMVVQGLDGLNAQSYRGKCTGNTCAMKVLAPVGGTAETKVYAVDVNNSGEAIANVTNALLDNAAALIAQRYPFNLVKHYERDSDHDGTKIAATSAFYDGIGGAPIDVFAPAVPVKSTRLVAMSNAAHNPREVGLSSSEVDPKNWAP